MSMDSKHTHLQMIQAVISRMAQNSFSLKGWAVTLIAGLFALTGKETNTTVGLVAYIPVVMFWLLDTYYLRQERLFRALYDTVRQTDPNTVDFSMDTSTVPKNAQQKAKLSWGRSFFSKTEFGFYGPLLAVVTVAAWLLGSF